MSMIFKINFYIYKRKWFSLFPPSTGILVFPSSIKIKEFLYLTDQFSASSASILLRWTGDRRVGAAQARLTGSRSRCRSKASGSCF